MHEGRRKKKWNFFLSLSIIASTIIIISSLLQEEHCSTQSLLDATTNPVCPTCTLNLHNCSSGTRGVEANSTFEYEKYFAFCRAGSFLCHFLFWRVQPCTAGAAKFAVNR